ncbi:MAG: hypothetical protein AB4368_33235 [Xenococcaceae cyanobacterium]
MANKALSTERKSSGGNLQKQLHHYFSLNRRYSRSVNLERDLEQPDALAGYVLTERAVDALRRILAGLGEEGASNAWTLTSVYGTGKSAFAHYLASLCASSKSKMRSLAGEITKTSLGSESTEYLALDSHIPKQGYLRAVAVAQREPISHTIVRALSRGVEIFWTPAKRHKSEVVSKLQELAAEIERGNKIEGKEIPALIQELAQASKTGIFLIIDELGKNLEYAAYNQVAEDLYLLQQLAELSIDSKNPVYILGILHQAFAGYSQRLASIQRNEWAKIQGRFEDIPFTESAGQMMRLIGRAINANKAETYLCAIHSQAQEWFARLESVLRVEELSVEILEEVYPLHPITALVLPTLCHRYAQNDRSLFTFLTSSEPFSFKNFLAEIIVETDSLPSLKLDRLYDYFIEAAGMGLASRPNLQRWVEIQDLIADASYLDLDSLRVLKTIGILNLVTITGTTRATRNLVTLAMCDRPDDSEIIKYWGQVVDKLLQRGLITHRRQLDELRIWQGSDFNVDSELSRYLEEERSPLFSLLSSIRPLKPLVAQRHSYQTGTLRYFERCYLDDSCNLEDLSCSHHDSDGVIGYWINDDLPTSVPQSTIDGKPLIILCAAKLDLLRIRAREYAALKKIQINASELQTDGVARREVRYRLAEAEKLLYESLQYAFELTNESNICWIQGQQETISSITDFNAQLSLVCDRVYHQSPTIWNELINRRSLTSQGAKARRELIEAMIERSDLKKLGLEGYGPEVTIYHSLLGETGIHKEKDGYWDFYPPNKESGVWQVWQAIDEFCLAATDKPRTLDRLYKILATSPYGIKQGSIPILLAAVLLYHIDDLGVYQDGTFIPILGAEHFELLLKDPSRFAVKYFAVVGLRSQVFKELEAILRSPKAQKSGNLRNVTLLTVVTPLYQFVGKLPKYTKQTKRLSQEAVAVIQALKKTVEPDELLFKGLPQAFGLPSISTDETDDGTIAKNLRLKLIQVLRELNTAYDTLLSNCQSLLQDAFGVRRDKQKLREDLRVRANYLIEKCIEPTLKRFAKAAIDEKAEDKEWLEALVMIVADKPAESWTDKDVTRFEIELADLVRRFQNLEALQQETNSKGEGLEARRITLTHADGQETHRLVWIDHEQENQVNDLVMKVLEILPNNSQIQQAVLTKLTETIFNKEQTSS